MVTLFPWKETKVLELDQSQAQQEESPAWHCKPSQPPTASEVIGL